MLEIQRKVRYRLHNHLRSIGVIIRLECSAFLGKILDGISRNCLRVEHLTALETKIQFAKPGNRQRFAASAMQPGTSGDEPG